MLIMSGVVSHSSKISTEIVSLDDPPEKRWMAITGSRKTEVEYMCVLVSKMF